MARLFFDLLILAALSKELLDLVGEQTLNSGVFLTAALALPFFLGMAPGGQGLAGIIRNPIRNLIRSGIALVSLIVYWYILLLKGVWWQFAALYMIAIGVYSLGRFVGLAWRAMWLITGLLLIVYLYLYLSSRG